MKTTTLVLLLAVLAAGCGNDPASEPSAAQEPTATATASPTPTPTPSPTPAATPTHSEFVASLNKTCTGDQDRLDEINAEVQERQTARDYAGMADSMQVLIDFAAPNWKAQDALVAPPQDSETFAAYMDSQHEFQGILKRLVAAIRAEDGDRMAFLSGALDDARQARLKAAVALGADRCGT